MENTYETIVNGKVQSEVTSSEPKSFERRSDARRFSRKSVGDDKIKNSYLTGNQTITISGDATGSGGTSISVTIANNAINQAKFKSEQVTVQISGTNTSGTATVVSGDIILGFYISATTGSPANPGVVTLSISGTTLTITIGTAPGVGNSITWTTTLLKS